MLKVLRMVNNDFWSQAFIHSEGPRFIRKVVGQWVKNLPAVQRHRRRRFDPWVRKIPWRRKWQPNPVFLPGKSHGQRSLAGYSPWSLKRVGHDLVTKQQQLLVIKLVQKAFTIPTKPGYMVTLLGSTSGELVGTQIICWGQFTTSASKVQWNISRHHSSIHNWHFNLLKVWPCLPGQMSFLEI